MKPICSICGWFVKHDGGYYRREDHCEHSWNLMHTDCVTAKTEAQHRGCSITVNEQTQTQCICLCHFPATEEEVRAAVRSLMKMTNDLLEGGTNV